MGKFGRFLSTISRFRTRVPIYSSSTSYASSSSSPPLSSSTNYSVLIDGALRKVWPKCSGKTMEGFLSLPKRPNLPNHVGFRWSAKISVLAGSICLWPIQANASDELRHGDELQNKKEDFYVLWKMARRLEIVVSLFLIVFSDWKNPMRLVVNFLLLLCSSCPRPYSVYIFNEQLCERNMYEQHLEESSKIQLFPAKKVDIQDYKLFCTAQVELAHHKLSLIGILGSWWTLHSS